MTVEENDRDEQQADSNNGAAPLAEIAKALGEIVAELKELNTSLRAIARSQAQRATQKRPPQGA